MGIKKPTYKELERKYLELQAQSQTALNSAYKNIDKAGDSLMGSAVIIQLSTLGGRIICDSFAIRDGLTDSTINALKSEIKRSVEIGKMYIPKELQ